MPMRVRTAELRHAMGITQDALATEIGVTQGTVSKWEAGTAIPRLEHVNKLTAFFGVPTRSLFVFDDDPPAEKTVTALFGRLSDGDKRAVLDLISRLSR